MAGAVFAGFAMVITLAIPLRQLFGLQDFITMRHMDNMAKVMLATGLIVVYGYAIEIFIAWYSGSGFEKYMVMNRLTGPYAWSWYALILCNFIAVQFLWSSRVRNSLPALSCHADYSDANASRVPSSGSITRIRSRLLKPTLKYTPCWAEIAVSTANHSKIL